jgi:N-acyl-D-amino-acid deacylase
MARVQPFVVRGASVLSTADGELHHLDVRVDDHGRIAELAPSVAAAEGDLVVDGSGRVLSPGFVDLHSHSDLYALERHGAGPPLGDGPKLLQGATAQVFGQDGISAAPVTDEALQELAASLSGLDGTIPLERWTWRRFGDYLDALRRTSATRVAALVGHSTVRRLVMGTANRPPSEDELEAMCRLVDEAMADGALGLSTGLVYVPAAFAGTDELVALASVVARRDGRLFVHVRSESDRVVEATEEILEVARRSGVRLHYSHIKTAGRANWPKAALILEAIEHYRSLGVRVSADVHPYTAGSTTASVLLPPWVLEGGQEAAIRRLGDPGARERMRAQLLGDTTSFDNWYAFSGGFEGLVVADAPPEAGPVTGLSFAEVVRRSGEADLTSPRAFDIVFDLLATSRLGASLISFNNVEENVARFLAQPFTSVGSDALVNPNGKPHPRLFGTFPRVLGRFVRELGTLDLPSALWRMTYQAAQSAGWTGPGRLEPGAAADLVLLDPERVADRATYDQPRLAPEGIERCWVAGRLVARDGHLLDEVPPAEEAEPEPH